VAVGSRRIGSSALRFFDRDAVRKASAVGEAFAAGLRAGTVCGLSSPLSGGSKLTTSLPGGRRGAGRPFGLCDDVTACLAAGPAHLVCSLSSSRERIWYPGGRIGVLVGGLAGILNGGGDSLTMRFGRLPLTLRGFIPTRRRFSGGEGGPSASSCTDSCWGTSLLPASVSWMATVSLPFRVAVLSADGADDPMNLDCTVSRGGSGSGEPSPLRARATARRKRCLLSSIQ